MENEAAWFLHFLPSALHESVPARLILQYLSELVKLFRHPALLDRPKILLHYF